MTTVADARFYRRLSLYYAVYTGGFVAFVLLMALAERMGLGPRYIGYAFMIATVALYAVIGVISRTADVSEYYVAGRRVPAFFNGMATGADWMSAASFLGLAGTLYHGGYQGLAFVVGWTGGFVLVALFLAPYLRRFGQYTIPDFLGARYGGNLPRAIGALGVIVVSFTYVVAQIYGVGIIASRFVGLSLEVGVFVGLAGILVCSFLGGMRAVTWTQVAQYIVLIVAYMTPVVMMSWKVTGVPIPQAAYGTVLRDLGERERALAADPKEIEARALFAERARDLDARINALPWSLEAERRILAQRMVELRERDAPTRELAQTERALMALPGTPAAARDAWSRARDASAAAAAPPVPHAQAHPGKDAQAADAARRNFIALVICLMLGTASLPHILVRYYTTPSVREARRSVFWSLFFIVLLYVTAPAYAVFAKWEVLSHVVGSAIADLPAWVVSWGKLGLVRTNDINGDGILQFAELSLNTDAIVLATPEIAGLPYVVAGLVAAGGLAAALSTADGLLLTIANALAHDVYYRMVEPGASTQRRLVVSKSVLLMVAALATYVATLRPDNILYLVGLAFSLAAATFFPALVMGIFWSRANRWGAVAGMLAGLGTTIAYAAITHPFFGGGMHNAWYDISPIAAGIFGVPAGFAALIVASLLTAAPGAEVRDFVESIRYPADEEDTAGLPFPPRG
jgi:cation/acetate symporter